MTDAQKLRLLIGVLWVAAAFAVGSVVGNLLCTPAAAEPYIAGSGGASLCPLTENDDEIECGDAPNPSLAVSGGLQTRYADFQIEGRGDLPELHGRNFEGGEEPKGDDVGVILSLCGNIWPGLEVAPGWRLYAGGGVCGSWARFYGRSDVVPAAQVGGGLQVEMLDNWYAELGLRAFTFLAPAEFERGLESRYRQFGGFLGVRHVF